MKLFGGMTPTLFCRALYGHSFLPVEAFRARELRQAAVEQVRKPHNEPKQRRHGGGDPEGTQSAHPIHRLGRQRFDARRFAQALFEEKSHPRVREY